MPFLKVITLYVGQRLLGGSHCLIALATLSFVNNGQQHFSPSIHKDGTASTVPSSMNLITVHLSIIYSGNAK